MVDFYKKDRPTPLDDLLRFYRLAKGSSSSILKTVTGSLLHITDALAKPAKKFTATLSPVQDLHGQDNPYPSGGGKNKYGGFTADFPTSSNGITYSLNSDGSIHVQGKATGGQSSCAVISPNGFSVGSGTWTISITSSTNLIKFVVGGSSNTAEVSYAELTTGNSKTFTTENGGTTGYNIVRVENGNEVNADFYIQFENGSSPTAWSPYSNICPITGHTGANVVRTGKNLSPVATNPDNPYAFWGGDFTELKAVLNSLDIGTYTISNKFKIVTAPDSNAVQHGRFYITAMVNGSQQTVLGYSISADSAAYTGKVYEESGTFTITEANKGNINHCYVYCDRKDNHSGTGRGTYNLYDIQIESGSTASTYEPYSGQTIPITFPDAAGTVYGSTLTLEDGVWKLRVTETAYTIPANKIYLSNVWCYSDAVRTEFGYTYNFTIKKCNLLKPDRYTNLTGSIPIICTENGGYIYFGWDNMKAVFGNTQAEIREYLTNNPLVINFELATPIEYTLTETQALSLLKGDNSIWVNDSDDLELTYYAKAEETP